MNFSFVAVTPHTKCRLKLLKLERIKDYLLMEEEYIRNQERLKPQEEKNEVCSWNLFFLIFNMHFSKIRKTGLLDVDFIIIIILISRRYRFPFKCNEFIDDSNEWKQRGFGSFNFELRISA